MEKIMTVCIYTGLGSLILEVNLSEKAICRGFGSLLAEQVTKLSRDDTKSHSKG